MKGNPQLTSCKLSFRSLDSCIHCERSTNPGWWRCFIVLGFKKTHDDGNESPGFGGPLIVNQVHALYIPECATSAEVVRRVSLRHRTE